jgi:hypothetical protein
MSHVSHYRKGLHLFMCQICASVHHSDVKRIMWNGAIVCPDCWNPREAQDFVRGVKDNQAVDNPSPEPEDVFLAPGEVTADSL